MANSSLSYWVHVWNVHIYVLLFFFYNLSRHFNFPQMHTLPISWLAFIFVFSLYFWIWLYFNLKKQWFSRHFVSSNFFKDKYHKAMWNFSDLLSTFFFIRGCLKMWLYLIIGVYCKDTHPVLLALSILFKKKCKSECLYMYKLLMGV